MSRGALNDAAAVARHSRRRIYQDAVYSLRQAGLNPMLATGNAPSSGFMGMDTSQGMGGWTSAVQGVSDAAGAVGGLVNSATNYNKMGPEVKYLAALENKSSADAAATDWAREREQSRFHLDLDQAKADIANTKQDTITKTAQGIAALAGGRMSEQSALATEEETERRKRENLSQENDPTMGDGAFAKGLRYLNAISSAIQGTSGAIGSARDAHDRLRPRPETETTTHHDASGAYKGHTTRSKHR